MSNTYCTFPFSHLNIKQKGKVSACWRYPQPIGEYDKQSLKEIWNDEEIKKLRKQFLNNERPSGCKSCWDLEDSGSQSTRHIAEDMDWYIEEDQARQITNEDFTIDNDKLKCIELRFENVCNLMCRHCSPEFSSQWEKAVKTDNDLYEGSKHNIGSRAFSNTRLPPDIIDEVATFDGLTHIMIAGGEPLYHNKHYKFLQDLQPRAKDITLDYNSNLTLLEYKGKSIIDLWKNFKEVSIRVSLDGDRHCYNYVRAKGDIDKVEENVAKLQKELKNLWMTMTCTVSNYNITRLDKIFDYFLSLNSSVHTSLVQYPEPLNPKCLPNKLKEEITETFNSYYKQKQASDIREKDLSRIKHYGYNVINYMNSEDRFNKDWDKFVAYTKTQDKFHNTNVLDIYPEFKPYWY